MARWAHNRLLAGSNGKGRPGDPFQTMSEEPTDQQAQDAAALARHLDGEEPTPSARANAKANAKASAKASAIEVRVAALEKFIEEGMHE